MKAKSINIRFIIIMFVLSGISGLVVLSSSNKISSQNYSVYEMNLPPSLEGISINSSQKELMAYFENKHIYERYLNIRKDITVVDPYLLYSQRYYTDYFNDFIVVELCDGKDYLLRFDTININKNNYSMAKDNDDYFVVYNKIFNIEPKDAETLRRLNPLLDREQGLSAYIYDDTVYKLNAVYRLDLDQINDIIKDYNYRYGQYKKSTTPSKTYLEWNIMDNAVRIIYNTDIEDKLGFVDYYRNEEVYNDNLLKIEMLNRTINNSIAKYKSNIYMDIVRNLSFEYKNKTDNMKKAVCDVDID